MISDTRTAPLEKLNAWNVSHASLQSASTLAGSAHGMRVMHKHCARRAADGQGNGILPLMGKAHARHKNHGRTPSGRKSVSIGWERQSREEPN
eukprot:6194014-Pleurochrysis_carterae.AAC.2